MRTCRVMILAGACLGGIYQASLAESQPPNVLLIVSDDQRPDTIGALGNEIIRTPHLDRLVARGTAFTRAIAANPICTPSRAELMTGASGFRNGVLDFGTKIRPELALWAETMRQAGYRTWYVGKWHNDGRPTERGYNESLGLFAGGGGKWWTDRTDWNGRPVTGYRGWVFQTDDRELQPEPGVGLTPDISERFADAAIEFIGRKPERPFFLHVNFTAPHDPLLMPTAYEGMYVPEDISVPGNFLPEHPFDHGNLRGRDEQLWDWPRTEEAVRRELAVYYAVITHMDEQIGRMLSALEKSGQRDRTLVIFTSDHGLAIGSHGLRGKQNMYEHTVGVPLIMSGPGIPAGHRADAHCYLRDLFPTVCDLAGIHIPPSAEGKSLKPVLEGTAAEVHPFVVAYFRDSQRMIRQGEWKLIEYPQAGRAQLFHLADDPLERKNLISEKKLRKLVEKMRKHMLVWGEAHDDPVLERLENAGR